MDKYELVGFLLQDLRDDRENDEEDIGPALLRETNKIYGLVIKHGHLTRKMFNTKGLIDPDQNHGLPERYCQYATTN